MHLPRARYVPQPESDSATLIRHGHLVDRLARRLSARTAGAVAADDLWSAGAMGLIDASRRFDAARDVRFETFAEHRIRGAMLDELRRMDHLPRRLRARTEEVERAREDLCRTLRREPTPGEVAAATGLDLEELGAIVMLTERGEQAIEEVEAPSALADEHLVRAQTLASMTGHVAQLPARLQLLLSLRYVEGLTYREIASVLEVSEPRVCQLHGQAMAELRSALRTTTG